MRQYQGVFDDNPGKQTADNRRFHYPVTNCTNCGPRLPIIDRMPSDRKFTSMASFSMCAACESVEMKINAPPTSSVGRLS